MRKPLGLFTIQSNEVKFLPIWLQHYAKILPQEDIHVIDHDSKYDMSPAKTNYPKVNWSNISYRGHETQNFLMWYAGKVDEKQRELLSYYEVVMFVAADELVFCKEDFIACLRKYPNPVLWPQGYEIIHLPKQEPPLDWSRPVMQQRKFWFRNELYYSKPTLCRVGVTRTHGCHDISKSDAGGLHPHTIYNRADPQTALLQCGKCIRPQEYALVHINRVDYDYSVQRYASAFRPILNVPDYDPTFTNPQIEAHKKWIVSHTWGNPIEHIPQRVIDTAGF